MQIRNVQRDDTVTIDALMRRAVSMSLTLPEDELVGGFGNITTNLHWAQKNAESVVHLKYVKDARIAGIILVKNFWNLCSLFVDPPCQRQGVGHALLTEAIQRCIARNDRGHIKVNSAPTAVQFYKKHGFSIIDGHPRRGTSLPMVLHLPRKSGKW